LLYISLLLFLLGKNEIENNLTFFPPPLFLCYLFPELRDPNNPIFRILPLAQILDKVLNIPSTRLA